MGQILLHFDGDITRDHRVTLRTLSKSLIRLQAAVDRAYLDTKYGGVWKGCRMSHVDYAATEFWSREPREGGYIIDFINESPTTQKILSRIVQAVTPAMERARQQGLNKATSLAEQAAQRSLQLDSEIVSATEYESFLPTASIYPYGDRAINKEIDQIAGLVRAQHAGESIVEIGIGGEHSSTFTFDRHTAQAFHSVVANRALGEPLIFRVAIDELDFKNQNGNVKNVITGHTVKLHFNEADFEVINRFFGARAEMRFIGCPVYEGGSYDARAGDIYFLRLA